MNTTRGKFLLTVTRGEIELLRRGFDDLREAHAAASEALRQYPDCEIRLTEGSTVLISAGPARPRVP